MYLRPICRTSSSLCWLVLPSWSLWSALLVLRLAVTQSAGENGWTLPIYGELTFKKTWWNFMVMVIYGYPKLPEGFQEEKWGTGWRVALRFSKWVDSQTLVMFMMAIPRSYMFCGERLATAIALWNLAPKWDSCEPVQNMLNVLVTFLNNSGWRVWPQNHLTDVSLAQSSRRNSLMDPKMVWTIANWWRIPIPSDLQNGKGLNHDHRQNGG